MSNWGWVVALAVFLGVAVLVSILSHRSGSGGGEDGGGGGVWGGGDGDGESSAASSASDVGPAVAAETPGAPRLTGDRDLQRRESNPTLCPSVPRAV